MAEFGWRSAAATLAGAAIGLLFGWRVDQDARENIAKAARLDFELASAQRSALVKEALTAPVDQLETLRRFLENSADVDAAEFMGFVSPWINARQSLRFAALRGNGRLGVGFIEPDLAAEAARIASSWPDGQEIAAWYSGEDSVRGDRLLIIRKAAPNGEYRFLASAVDLSRRIAGAIGPIREAGIKTSVFVSSGGVSDQVFADSADSLESGTGKAPFTRIESVETAGSAFTIRIEAATDYISRRRTTLGLLFVPGSSLLFALLLLWIERIAARGDRAEQQRRAALADLNHFFSLDLDLFCVTDSKDLFLRVNPAWKRIFGYLPRELIGTSFLDLIHPDDKALVVNETSKGGRRGSMQGFVARARCKDGGWRRVEWKAAALGERIYTAARDVTQREEYESRLRKSVAEKETLLREVHHRVKNNMQIISSLLNLQGQGIRDPQINDAIERAQGRIRTMAMVHDALYHSSDFTDIDFDEYAQSLASYCVYGMDRRGFAVKVVSSGIKLGLDLAIPCGLILNELVSNSARYAFASAGTTHLTISLSGSEKQMTLEVCDDGQGLGEGFILARDGKLGMSLVSSLAAQIGGKLEIESGPGTRERVVFKPLPGSFVPGRPDDKPV